MRVHLPPPLMTAGFEFYTDGAGEHRWRLKDTNGRTVADSGEGYGSKRDAEHGADVLTRLGPDAPEHERGGSSSRGKSPGWEYFSGSNGEWYWRFEAANGKITADGAEGYASKANIQRAITNVKGLLRSLQKGSGSGFEKPKDKGPSGGGRFA